MVVLRSSTLLALFLVYVITKVTSHPELIAADYASLFQSPHLANARTRYHSDIIDRLAKGTLELVPDDAHLNDLDQPEIDVRSPAEDAEYEAENSAELQDVLAWIANSLNEMEKTRGSRVRSQKTGGRPRLREPMSRFVRIGRGGAHSRNTVDDSKRHSRKSQDADVYYPAKYHPISFPGDSKERSVSDAVTRSAFDTYIPEGKMFETTLARTDARKAGGDTYPFEDSSESEFDIADSSTDNARALNSVGRLHNAPEYLQRYRRDYTLLRYGRASDPKNNVPKRSEEKPSQDVPLVSSANHADVYVPTTGYPEEEGGMRDFRKKRGATSVSTAGPVSRRSYIRIGRLPSSVFLKRLVSDGRDTVAVRTPRRSRGYRLTSSGLVRAGK